MKYVTDDLASYRVAHAVDGVKVTCQSTLIEAYFKKVSKVMTKDYEAEWCGLMPYALPANLNSTFFNSCLGYWKHPKLFNGGTRPNMSFLRAEGLKDGIDVIFKMPCSEAYLTRFKRLIGINIQRFYRDVVHPQLICKRETREEEIKWISPRHRDIYKFAEYKGVDIRTCQHDVLHRLQNELKVVLESRGLSPSDIRRRTNNHVA